MLVIPLNHDFVMPHLEQLCFWAEANGLRPKDIPIGTDSVILIDSDSITVKLFVRALDGRIQMGTDGEPVTTTATVPLVMPWPAELMPTD